jgi:hypothetical protein
MKTIFMKKLSLTILQVGWIGAAMVVGLTVDVRASESDSTSTPIPTNAAAVNATAPVTLSKSAQDILKLSKASIAEDTIITFIENSERFYALGVQEILYLRQEGVSDRVITAMLKQRASGPAQIVQPVALPAPAAESAPAPEPAVNPQEATASTTQTATAPPAVTYVPTSPVYVAPPAYYGYPYWGYYGRPYPAFSLSFGFGGYYGGHYGGYYGGHYGGHYGGGGHHH